MKKIHSFPGIRLVVWYLVMAISGLALAPAVAQAAFVSSLPPSDGVTAEDLAVVRQSLQKELVAERLSAMGLDPAGIEARLDGLSAAELESVAADAERLQSGGDGLGTLVTLAILVLIVLLILKISDKEVIIK